MWMLQDKVAIITGAGSGIGQACAGLFARQGARVVLGGRRAEMLEKGAAAISAEGGRAVALAGDVQDDDYACALVELALASYGAVDIAVNNAGTLGDLRGIDQLPLREWDRVIQTNLSSAFFGARHQIPAMARSGGGSLIFTSSFVGYSGAFPGTAAYAASKAGLIGLTQALAVEWGEAGIRVNALLPGGTDTSMSAEFGDTEASRDFVRGIHALGRIARPEEIAQAALYLASDASSFTTGHALLADGGVSVKWG